MAKSPWTGSGFSLGADRFPNAPSMPMPTTPAGTTMPQFPQRPPMAQGITPPPTGGGMPVGPKPGIIGNANPGPAPQGGPGRSGMAPPRTGMLPNGKAFPGQGHAWGLHGGNPNNNPMGQGFRTRLANSLARPPLR